MKRITLHILLTSLIILSCSGLSGTSIRAKYVSDISGRDDTLEITAENAGSILKKHTIEFTIPNPLFGEDGRERRFDPNHESTINCRAVLLDDFSSEADMTVQSSADSLDGDGLAEFRAKYIEDNIREGMFRIRLEMESGFSERSLDPEHWAMYLENSSGVMIEPFEIESSIVSANQDSVYSTYYDRNFARKLLNGEISLYFKKMTFFGEDLLDGDNRYIVLVISRNKRTVARVAWEVSKEDEL
ncbi:hypothetical protein ACFL6P_07135 [Candidatus Latescibacterota bacterium]